LESTLHILVYQLKILAWIMYLKWSRNPSDKYYSSKTRYIKMIVSLPYYHHVWPPNQHFLLSAKMNGTQRRACTNKSNTLYVLQYAKRHLSSWSDIKKWKSSQVHSLSNCWSEGISQSVSQSVSRKFCYINNFYSNLLNAFQVNLKACLGLVLPKQYFPIVIW